MLQRAILLVIIGCLFLDGNASANTEGSVQRNALFWEMSNVPARWHSALESLGENCSIKKGKEGGQNAIEVRIAERPRVNDIVGARGSIVLRNGVIFIEVDEGFPVGRLLGWALSGKLKEGIPIEDESYFRTRAVMFDLARNAVLKPEKFEKWFSEMFLMGYNQGILYLEDIFEVPGEPYFGYLRGRYSEADLKSIDALGEKFGIEVVASIQTLSHLGQVLKWPVYKDIKHNAETISVGNQASYKLIEKMVAVISRSIKSRRIHVGMDESAKIKFPDFLAHLKKVNQICEKYEYKNVDIWSDMYFRIASKKHAYYDAEIVFPEDMRNSVPGGVNLVYWDYNTFDKNFYTAFIRKHQELSNGRMPIVALGLWTWGRSFWYDQRRVKSTVTPALLACREVGVTDVIFTMWRDDGAFSHLNSTLGGLSFSADLCFANNKWTEDNFEMVLGVPWEAIEAISSATLHLNPTSIAWDDPLLGRTFKMFNRVNSSLVSDVIGQYDEILKNIEPYKRVSQPVDFSYGYAMMKFLRNKIAFQRELKTAYEKGDRKAVESIAKETLPRLILDLEDFIFHFRRQWMDSHRPFGLEVMQARFGAQLLRLQDATIRLEEYAKGSCASLEELDEDIAPPVSRKQSEEFPYMPLKWRDIYTTSQ